MSRIVFIFVLSVLVAGQIASQSAQPLTEWEKLGATDFDTRLRIIGNLTAEHREELIAEIKAARMPSDVRPQYKPLLLHLGDEETMREEGRLVMDDNHSEWTTATSILATCRDLRVIEQIAPALFYTADEDLTTNLPRSSVAEMAMAEVMTQTPGLNSAVYDWLKAIGPALPYHQVRVMRTWWKANEEHFKKHDFLAVQPGEIPPPADLVEVYKDANGKYAVRLRAGVTWPPQSGNNLPQSSNATPPPHEGSTTAKQNNGSRSPIASHTISSALLAIIVVAGVLLGGFFLVLRRK